MQVRRANPSDAPAILPLVAEYWQFEGLTDFEPSVVQAQLERLLSSPQLGAAWLAEDARQPIGYLILVFVFSLEHHGLTAEIDELFVLPARRGAGAGKLLLAEAEAEACRRGCRNISLQIGRSNAAAREFYSRCGYQDRAGFDLLEKALNP